MKARIEKKLCKKLVQLAPKIFNDAWIDKDVSEKAIRQGSSVSHVYSVGGGIDYWGEGEDEYTALELMKMNWMWFGDFDVHEEGHKFEGYPDTGNFKPTSRNLLRIASAHG